MNYRKRARELRKNMTRPEVLLWSRLQCQQLAGRRFRSQHVIGDFIVDFACLAENLVIEVDGEIHSETREGDVHRDAWLKGQGYRVLRFSNENVLFEIEGVLEAIVRALEGRES